MAASDFAIVAPRMADDPREVLDLAPSELRAALTPRTRKAAALLGRYFRDEGGFNCSAFAKRDAVEELGEVARGITSHFELARHMHEVLVAEFLHSRLKRSRINEALKHRVLLPCCEV